MTAERAVLTERGQQQQQLAAIRDALKTHIVTILHAQVPELSNLSPHAVYDHILSSPEMLHQCFQVFREKPDLFRKVVITPAHRPVTSGDEPLLCGRTLDEVVALVVRTSAKRYFRSTLGVGTRPIYAPLAPPSLLQKAAIQIGLKKPPRRRILGTEDGPGDTLYSAFRANLLFEWQVPLLPNYATLEPRVVSKLGARILDLRDPKQIDILAADGLTPEGFLPLMLADATRLCDVQGGLSPAALAEAFTKLGLEAMFPLFDETGLKRAVSQMSVMDPTAVLALIPALERDLRAFTVFIFSVFSKLEPKAFKQALGPHCPQWAVQKLAKHIQTCRPWPRSLPGMKTASEKALAFAFDTLTGLPAKDVVRSPVITAPPKPSPAAKVAATAPKPPPPAHSGHSRAARTPVS